MSPENIFISVRHITEWHLKCGQKVIAGKEEMVDFTSRQLEPFRN